MDETNNRTVKIIKEKKTYPFSHIICMSLGLESKAIYSTCLAECVMAQLIAINKQQQYTTPPFEMTKRSVKSLHHIKRLQQTDLWILVSTEFQFFSLIIAIQLGRLFGFETHRTFSPFFVYLKGLQVSLDKFNLGGKGDISVSSDRELLLQLIVLSICKHF